MATAATATATVVTDMGTAITSMAMATIITTAIVTAAAGG
jgi:hypothetical protein